MNPEWRAKWVAALRSGKYRQGHGTLKNTYMQSSVIDEAPPQAVSKYCCLGVLEEIVGVKSESCTKLTGPILEIVGVCGPDKTDHTQHILMQMNDGVNNTHTAKLSEPQTFSQIADWIEANL